MKTIDIRNQYIEETGESTMELTKCELGARYTTKYVKWLESKLKKNSISGNVINSAQDDFDRGFTAGMNTAKKLIG